MAVLRDRITVIPPDGETVAVDILEASVSLGTVYAERTKPRTLTLPLAISERTSLFVPAGGGPYSVSVKLGTTEIAGDGAPVTVSSFPAEIHATVDTAELGDVVGSGGSVAPGVPVISAYPFAFDTPGLAGGVETLTPAIGDLLLDAWIEVDTAWNGTTPKADVGQFLAENGGWFSYGAAPVDMSSADALSTDPTPGLLPASMLTQPNDLFPANSLSLSVLNNKPPTGTLRAVPAKFTTADPVKVCVSQNGTNTGAATGATQGAAVLYLVTCTPKF